MLPSAEYRKLTKTDNLAIKHSSYIDDFSSKYQTLPWKTSFSFILPRWSECLELQNLCYWYLPSWRTASPQCLMRSIRLYHVSIHLSIFYITNFKIISCINVNMYSCLSPVILRWINMILWHDLVIQLLLITCAIDNYHVITYMWGQPLTTAGVYQKIVFHNCELRSYIKWCTLLLGGSYHLYHLLVLKLA